MQRSKHRRGRKPRRQLRRDRPTREAYDRVLIVTEGQKTEPIYFSDFLNHYRLSNANIEVVGEGADPKMVVRRALQLRRREKRRGDGYDRVYCVFDRNGHANFHAAGRDAERNGLRLARSWPCFEYWLLLHFGYVRKPFVSSGGRSACENCTQDLREHLAGYHKAIYGVFDDLSGRMESAKVRAARAIVDARKTGEDNPSTEVHKLVKYLQRLPESG